MTTAPTSVHQTDSTMSALASSVSLTSASTSTEVETTSATSAGLAVLMAPGSSGSSESHGSALISKGRYAPLCSIISSTSSSSSSDSDDCSELGLQELSEVGKTNDDTNKDGEEGKTEKGWHKKAPKKRKNKKDKMSDDNKKGRETDGKRGHENSPSSDSINPTKRSHHVCDNADGVDNVDASDYTVEHQDIQDANNIMRGLNNLRATNSNPEHENILFVRGTSTNFARIAFNRAVEFNKYITTKFGSFTSIKIKDDHLIITCKNQTQKAAVKQEVVMLGCSINITDPSSSTSTRNQILNRIRASEIPEIRETYNKGIIFGVPVNVNDNDIIDETGATAIRRLISYADGSKKETETVVLSFIEEIPSTVYIGFLKFNVKVYIPHPFRCNNCQLYGHSQRICYRPPRCPRCSGSHTFDSCPNKDDDSKTKCPNCHGNHSAAWKMCPKHEEIKETLKLTVVENLSYRDALTKVKKQKMEKERDKIEKVQLENATNEQQHIDDNQPDTSLPTEETNSLSRDNTSKTTMSTNLGNKLKEKSEVYQDKTKVISSDKYSKPTEDERIHESEHKLDQAMKMMSDIASMNSHLLHLVGFLIVGVFFNMDNGNQQINPEQYKRAIIKQAEVCGINFTDLWEQTTAATS